MPNPPTTKPPLSAVPSKAPQEPWRPAPHEENALQAHERVIAAEVTRLLSHYWMAAEDPRIRQLQLDDWLDDLTEFASATVVEACKAWRRTEQRRPTPADLRRLCQQREHPEPKLALPVPTVLPTPEQEKAERQRRYGMSLKFRLLADMIRGHVSWDSYTPTEKTKDGDK